MSLPLLHSSKCENSFKIVESKNSDSHSGEDRLLMERNVRSSAVIPSKYLRPPIIRHPLTENVVLSALKSCGLYFMGILIAVPFVAVVTICIIVVIPLRCLFYILTRWTFYGLARWLRQRICDQFWPLNLPYDNCGKANYHELTSAKFSSFSYCVVTCQGSFEIPEVRSIVWKKILHACDARGYLKYPYFTQKLVAGCNGCLNWTLDPTFDVQNHVLLSKLEDKNSPNCFSVSETVEDAPLLQEAADCSVAVVPQVKNSLKSLENHLNILSEKKMSFKYPPWDIEVIPEFGESRCTLLLFRFYTPVTEGLCLPRLISLMSDTDCEIEVEPKLNYSVVPLAWSLSQALVLGPAGFLYSSLCPAKPINGSGVWEYMRRKDLPSKHILTWARVPNSDHLSRLERLLHCTTVELFIAFVAGALRTHLRASGVKHPPDIQVSIPVSLVDDNEAAHRRSSANLDASTHRSPKKSDYCDTVMVTFDLPVSVEGCVPRVWEVQRRLADLLEGPKPFATRLGACVCSLFLPKTWTKTLFKRAQHRSSCIISFFRSSVELGLRGHKIHSILLYNTVPRNSIFSSFNFVQVGREVVLSLSVDQSIFPNPDQLLVNFQAESSNLLKQVSGRLFSPLTAALLPVALAGAISVKTVTRPMDTLQANATTTITLPSSPSSPPSEVSESSLEELESLLETVQTELQFMRENPIGNRETYYAKLTEFEAKMEALHNIIAQKLQFNNNPLHPHGRALSTPSMTAARASSSSPPDILTHSNEAEYAPLFSGVLTNARLKRKRSRRTSSPTAVRAKIFGTVS